MADQVANSGGQQSSGNNHKGLKRIAVVVAGLGGAAVVNEYVGHPILPHIIRDEDSVQKKAREKAEELVAPMADGEAKIIAKHNFNQLILGIEGHTEITFHPPSQIETAKKVAEDFSEKMKLNPKYMEEFIAKKLTRDEIINENAGLKSLLKNEYGITDPMSSFPKKTQYQFDEKGNQTGTVDPLYKRLRITKPQEVGMKGAGDWQSFTAARYTAPTGRL